MTFERNLPQHAFINILGRFLFCLCLCFYSPALHTLPTFPIT